MARTVTVEGFARIVASMAPDMEEAAIEGLQSAALRLEGMVVEEIDDAQPFPAVDRGELRNSVATVMRPDGADVVVSAPHAAPIEEGTRPFRPPFAPIYRWVLRKGLAGDEDAAAAVAAAVVRKIERYGIEPRHYFRRAWQRLPPILRREVDRAIARGLG